MSFKYTKLSMRKQQGFSLAELSVTTVITTMIIIGGIQMQAYQATQEAAQSIAQMYQRISKAADSYMANHYGLLRNLPDACSNLPFAGGTMLAIPPGPPAVGCSISIPSALPKQVVVVANAFQPTLAELRQLGFLVDGSGAQFVNQLPITTFGSMAGHPLQIVDGTTNPRSPAPNEFRVLIRRIALAGAPPDLQSLVFNLQPFNLTNSSRASDVLLDLMVQAGGGDAFLSDSEKATNGRLRAQAGAAENSLANPLQVVFNNQVQGAPYVFAMRGGFGSSGYDQFVRRDGTQTLTAAWNVGGQDITGVSNLGAVNGNFSGTVSAATGNFSGDISANNGNFKGNINVAGNGSFTGDISGRDISGRNGKLSGNLSVTGDISGRDISGRNGTFTGDLSANKGTFSGLLSGVSATFSGALEAASAKINGLLEAASAKIAGALEVVGNAVLGSLQVKGAATLDSSLSVAGTTALNGQTTAQQFRLGAQASLGGSCDPSKETVARFVENEKLITPYQPKIMVCDPNTNKWTYAVNFADEITGLNTSVTNLGNTLSSTNSTLTSVSSSISTINNSISTLDGRVTALETNVSGLTSSVSTLQTGYSSLTNSVGSLQTDVADLKKYRLKWDIINVNWDRRDKVWKKTPWKCNQIGGLSDSGDVRYLKNASDNQTAGSYTMPMMVGLDTAPKFDTIVYDFNCVTQSEASAKGVTNDADYWYVGMSSTRLNMFYGNSCKQGLSTNISFNDKHYLISTQDELNKVEGGYLTSVYSYYPKITLKMWDSVYRGQIDLPSIGSLSRELTISNGSTNPVTVSGVSQQSGETTVKVSVKVGSGTTLRFINGDKGWSQASSAPTYNSNCSGSGFIAAPVNLTGFNEEPMAARFIAFTRPSN